MRITHWGGLGVGVTFLIGGIPLILTGWQVVGWVMFVVGVAIIIASAGRRNPSDSVAYTEMAPVKKSAAPDPQPHLAGEKLKCLQLLASGEVNYSAKEVAARMSIPEQKAQYYLDRLFRSGEAESYVNPYGETSRHRMVISAKGRETLVNLGLL